MNKYKRLEEITKLVNEKGSIRIADIVSMLNVTDMTVRRDLMELEKQGVLIKTHGGAKSKVALRQRERSHHEKHAQNMEQKRYIAKLAAQKIEEGDTIFLGPGTTAELLAEEINNQTLSVVTNCYPVFNILFKKKSETFKVFLLGGQMRELTESFVGEITNTILEKMKFNKMFFSGNAVKGNEIMTSSFAEAYTQQIALKNSVECYLLLDSSKIGKEDFTTFYYLTNITALISDNEDLDKLQNLSEFTTIITE
ncbi:MULTISPECIES: DeoR/GlpR family DNA-binding transcription regulator [unclassified Granulicatella]|uniref:DeoR/GlpR family DNA-binding transcription regulator n=1 Tax=unclassified Granulicatella TaxID=2630493 RepID=UPI0010749B8C|nr:MULTISPECIES: DeoR/GlpR family DNA-binding transcription regulator [unclassified Granulicatella]MBF0779733.1 DeoR/GlpR transcriptional regulator [Granulicatella sp. 19428wC4_WM01]TFU96252.1 DeoR/GlpR transcriptional regulator [Granulicatella sp. WM01]